MTAWNDTQTERKKEMGKHQQDPAQGPMEEDPGYSFEGLWQTCFPKEMIRGHFQTNTYFH